MKRIRLIGILALMTLTTSALLAQSRVLREDSSRPANIRGGQVIVRLSGEAKIAQLNGRQGTRTLEQIPGTDYYLLELPEGARVSDRLRRFSEEPGIIEAVPNYSYRAPEVLQTSQAFIDQTSQAFIDQTSQAFIDAGVPVSFTRQKSVSSLHLAEAQRYSQGAGVKVAIVDTGIDFSHPLFRGRIEYPVYDFVDDDGNPSEEPGAGYGHGTFIAGLIALTAPRATVMPVRAFAGDGTGTSFSIARAIRFAADNGADIINMSFGLLEEDSLVKDAINYASRKAYLVAAAGNDDENFIHFP
ncbi:MAG: S8 family serine peptidase, partial [Acidobacteriota bacterium]